MSRDSSIGNAPVTMVTSVPWERERDITVDAVFATSPQLTVFSIRFWYNCSRASHLYCLELVVFACFATIGRHLDWREPIGLQERLKGRSSHNGEISVMSRSRSQGTEVTIVTGAFSLSFSFAFKYLINAHVHFAFTFISGQLLIYNLQWHIFCNKHGTLINKTNKNTPLPCYKPNIKLQTCKMFKCKKKHWQSSNAVAPNE